MFYDKNALKRIELYKKISNLFSIKIVKNDSDISLTVNNILSDVGINGKNS